MTLTTSRMVKWGGTPMDSPTWLGDARACWRGSRPGVTRATRALREHFEASMVSAARAVRAPRTPCWLRNAKRSTPRQNRQPKKTMVMWRTEYHSCSTLQVVELLRLVLLLLEPQRERLPVSKSEMSRLITQLVVIRCKN